MKNPETTLKLIQKTKFAAKLLQLVPFNQGIILNGSLACNEVKESSDIDILVVVKDGRIFTVRFFINILLSIFRLKRPSNDTKPHVGKICPNYFMTESFLTIPMGRGDKIDQYCANCYGNAVLVFGEKSTMLNFRLKNTTLFKLNQLEISPRFVALLSSHFPITKNKLLLGLAKVSEFVLRGSFGDQVERFLKKLQVAKIETDPRTKKYPDLIRYNDQELRFHPPKQA